MASHTQKLLLITLILTLTISISTAHRRHSRRPRNSDDTQQYLRDLCSDIDRSDICVGIVKSNSNRFETSSDDEIVSEVIDLALAKSNAVADQLNKWYEDTTDDSMRDKYRSCADNYEEVSGYLEDAQRTLDSDDFERVSDVIDEARDELNRCVDIFGSDTFDPGHVENRNNEIGAYLDLIRAASARLD